MSRRCRLVLLCLVMLAGLASAAEVSAATAPVQPSAHATRLAVGVEVLRFSAAGRSLKASGMVTAKLTDNTGHTSVTHAAVALSASTGGRCKVLHLFLNELSLNLLGLDAHLDKVQLDITGQPRGGVLGSLFCKLARTHVAADRAATARALTVAVRHHANHVLRFTAYLAPTTTTSPAANAICPVLNLIVGPLDLQLLGLQVDLNRVHLVVTADRGGGALGVLFCKLSNNTLPATLPTP